MYHEKQIIFKQKFLYKIKCYAKNISKLYQLNSQDNYTYMLNIKASNKIEGHIYPCY